MSFGCVICEDVFATIEEKEKIPVILRKCGHVFHSVSNKRDFGQLSWASYWNVRVRTEFMLCVLVMSGDLAELITDLSHLSCQSVDK